jgi:riboflavin synthase
MFTGLIQQVGRLQERKRAGAGWSLRIAAAWAEPLEVGESVAVQGACLTVTAAHAGAFTADLLDETIARSSMGKLATGVRVNLERALRLADRLGGHLVSGHVDECGKLLAVRPQGRDRIVRVGCSAALCRQMAVKGSVAIDGISLTVSAVGDDWLEAHVIPHTWEATTLSDRQPGDTVNLEGDLLAKYVARLLGADGRRGLTADALAQAGFV